MNQVYCENFNEVYPKINSWILSKGVKSTSRNGDVKKVREFVTRISNPSQNMVGGYEREINPFFLFVEAMWIWLGRKDVAPLIPFNSRMGNYSDDGQAFHAAYGFRLREHFGIDQINKCIDLLEKDKDSRRAVMQIWSATDDCGAETKDIPCNDTIALSIGEDEKLRMSIFNRSNDLHWGLPTNVYQFSFMGKLMANCLGIEYGHQTHFSNDLHCYLDNPIAERMEKGYNNWESLFSEFGTIYDYCNPISIKLDFEGYNAYVRLNQIDLCIDHYFDIIDKGDVGHLSFVNHFQHGNNISTGFLFMVASCLLYKEMKKAKSESGSDKEALNQKAISDLIEIAKFYGQSGTDFALLAINFFASKLKDKSALVSLLVPFHCNDENVKKFIGYL